MTDESPVTAAPTRRSLRNQVSHAPASIPSVAPAASASDVGIPLTRAELRRRAAAAAEARNGAAAPDAAALPIAPSLAAAQDAEALFTAAVLDPSVADSGVIRDEFEAAAELFAFTGETPIQVAAAARDADAQVAVDAEPERGSRAGASFFRRAMTTSASLGAMAVVGLIAVGMTTPAEAVAGAAPTAPGSALAFGGAAGSAISPDEIQAYVAPADAQSAAFDRSDYRTASTAELAAESGISHFSRFFTNNPNSPIQWPFSVGVPISYGYGMRDGAMHEGLDFTPGNGAQIQAVADGTVRTATESGGGYGVMVIIDHVIDGERVSTRYGHMQYGSLAVKAGDTVKVGQIIGLVGDTGHSFGAHLHFEVLDGGTTSIDPLPWLRLHAGG